MTQDAVQNSFEAALNRSLQPESLRIRPYHTQHML